MGEVRRWVLWGGQWEVSFLLLNRQANGGGGQKKKTESVELDGDNDNDGKEENLAASDDAGIV